MVWGLRFREPLLDSGLQLPKIVGYWGTLTYQNLLFCRVPINSILGLIIRTYKKVGFGSLRYIIIWYVTYLVR